MPSATFCSSDNPLTTPYHTPGNAPSCSPAALPAAEVENLCPQPLLSLLQQLIQVADKQELDSFPGALQPSRAKFQMGCLSLKAACPHMSSLAELWQLSSAPLDVHTQCRTDLGVAVTWAEAAASQ